jgi:hypothetical protein
MNFGFQCDCECGKCSWCCLKEVYAWGSGTTSADTTNQSRADAPLYGTRDPAVERQSPWIDISTNGLSTWAIMQDGSLWGWGQGPLGDGSSTGKNYPVFIDNGPWVKVFAGLAELFPGSLSSPVGRCYAIKQDGSLWGWGGGLPGLPPPLTIQSIQIRARLSAPVVGAVITSGGNYTSTPSVSVVQQGGSGSVTSHASVVPRMKYSGGNVTVTAPGSGYLAPPFVEITAAGFDVAPPGFEVTPARYTVRTRHPVASVALTSGGSGYEFPPQVVFQFGGGSGAAGIAVIQNGVVVGVTMTSPGANYGEFSPPTVRFEGGNPATAASGTAILGEGFVSFVSLAAGGHYTHPISLRLSSGNASISFTQSGVVEGIEIIDGGGGYTSTSGDRPLLQFSHGSASGFCTLAPGGVHSAVLRPASVTSIPPPLSDDTTGTVNVGGPFAIRWPVASNGVFQWDFNQILSAQFVDGNDRRDIETSAQATNLGGGFPGRTYSVSSVMTGWKNRPRVRVIAKNADFVRSVTSANIDFAFRAYQGCPPASGIDISSLPFKNIPGKRQFFSGAGASRPYAIKNATTTSPGAEVREKHGIAVSLGTSVADAPGHFFETTDSYDCIGLKSQAIYRLPDSLWVSPVRRTIDFAADPANGYGCGAKLRANVTSTGHISAELLDPGCNYTEEPLCVIPAGSAASFPRLIDSGGGWSDVAIATQSSIGIKGGLLYKWSGLLGPPSRVGKRLQIEVTPKDKHSRGRVAGLEIFGEGEHLNISSSFSQLTVGIIIDFPQSSGGSPFIPIPDIIFTGTAVRGGECIGRYQIPDGSQQFATGSSDEKSGGTFSGGLSYSPNPRDIDFFPEFEGSMVLKANPGDGYLEMPDIELSEFCDFNISPSLVGPDECVSVSSVNGLWALDSEGTLWEIGPGQILIDEPPFVAFNPTGSITSNSTGLILFDTAGIARYAVYEVAKSNAANSFLPPQDIYARLISNGSGYRNASLDIELDLIQGNTTAGATTTTSGELVCTSGLLQPGYPSESTFERAEQTYSQSTAFTFTLGFPLSTWRGQVFAPSELLIRRNFWSNLFFGFSTSFSFASVSSSSVIGDGENASYELFEGKKSHIVTSAFTPDPVSGMTFDWIAKGGSGGFYGRTRAGVLMGFARSQTVNLFFTTPGAVSRRNFFPYPSTLNAASSHGGLIIDANHKLYSIGSPSIGPEKTRGSIELLISSPGEGYTEPILAQFSSQPPGVAVADPQISGEVVAVGVTNSGSGWSSPPVVSISGSAQGQVIWGGPVESIAVTNGGSGYLVPPSVRFSSPGIPPDGVSAVISGGSVASVSLSGSGGRFRQVPQVFFDPNPHLAAIEVTSGGSGYESSPSVLIVGGGGAGAAARSELNGSVDPTSLALNSGGVGYQSEPQVVFTGGGGSGASASCQVSEQGIVQSITLTSPGSGYTSPPTIQFVGGGGNGAAATCGIKGPVARVIITSIGSGHESAPLVFFQGGNGDGAAAVAQMAFSGSGAAATARIDGRVLSVRVTDAGSGYQSSPAVTFSGGQNFKASGQELLDSDFMPRAQARISGSISSVNIQQAGQNYMTGNIAAHDVNGESIQANPVQFVGPRESGPASPTGTAAVSANSPPGSGVQSISLPPQDRKFASKPKAIFPNSWPIDCRTSLRIAGIAIKPKTTHPNSVFSSILKLSDGSISRAPASSSDVTFVTFLSSPTPFGEANLQGSLIGSGGEVVRANIAAQFIRDFPFDTPPEVKFFCDSGAGALHTIPLDSDGFLAGTSFWVGDSVNSSGQNYGPYARCLLSGGVRKVIPPMAVAVLQGGVVVAVNMQSEGSGYSAPPIVVFSGGGGSGASGVANLSGGNGARRGVSGVNLTSGGGGYKFPPQVSFVFNESTLPADSMIPRTVQLRNVVVEGIELVSLPDFERMEAKDLQVFQNGYMFWSQGHPGAIGGNDPANRIDYYIFFEDGFLAGLSMPISSSDSLVFLKELQGGVSVQLSAPCKTPAVVTVVRPTWEIASQSSNSFAAKRLT